MTSSREDTTTVSTPGGQNPLGGSASVFLGRTGRGGQRVAAPNRPDVPVRATSVLLEIANP